MPEPRWRRYLRFWKRNVAADVDDELRFHFEERVEELRAEGLTRDEAVSAARAQFGDPELVRAALVDIDERVARKRDSAAWFDALRLDLVTSIRSLRRQPAFSAAIIVTLALGLGVNAAMFSFLDRVFLRMPSGIERPADLRRLWAIESDKKGVIDVSTLTVGVEAYAALKAALAPDVAVALFTSQGAVRFGDDDAGDKTVGRVAADYFPLLGVHAARGRLFTADEATITGPPAPVVVISDAMWRNRFGGDSAILGKPLVLNGDRLTIIGVTPPGFRGPDLNAIDAWLPLGENRYDRMRVRGTPEHLGVLLRRRSAASDESIGARATLAVQRARVGEMHDDSLQQILTGSIIQARGPGKEQTEIVIAERLGAVAVIVLLIACANVMNLLLARAVARRREIAVRVALGISRARLIWLLAAPNLVLALAAGVAAAASAQLTGSALRAQLTPNIQFTEPAFHWRVVAFALLAGLAAGVVSALVPAVQASRPDVTTFLKSGAQSGFVQRSRLRTGLLVVQAALSLVLLVGAGLFVRSLWKVESIRIGYDADRLLFAYPLYSSFAAPDSERMAASAARIARLPGVAAVGMATMAPMNGGLLGGKFYTATDSSHGEVFDGPSFMGVSPNYFTVTGVRIVRGTGFAPEPTWSILVNETMAREYWPNGDAIGQCMRLSKRENPCYTVVGITEDAHRRRVVEKPHAHYFVPLTHPPGTGMRGYTLVIRVDPERMSVVTDAARRIMVELHPGARPVLQRMDDTIAPAYRPFRLGARLFTVFGLLAFVVAIVGVYSTISYAVQQRTHEFGVRIALGAAVENVLANVIPKALAPVLVGVAIGLAIALAAGRLVASLLYEVAPTDIVVMLVVPALLLAAAFAAALVPALRAARVDPVIALKAE